LTGLSKRSSKILKKRGLTRGDREGRIFSRGWAGQRAAVNGETVGRIGKGGRVAGKLSCDRAGGYWEWKKREMKEGPATDES